jgi:hypothetical protein
LRSSFSPCLLHRAWPAPSRLACSIPCWQRHSCTVPDHRLWRFEHDSILRSWRQTHHTWRTRIGHASGTRPTTRRALVAGGLRGEPSPPAAPQWAPGSMRRARGARCEASRHWRLGSANNRVRPCVRPVRSERRRDREGGHPPLGSRGPILVSDVERTATRSSLPDPSRAAVPG